MSEQQRCIYCQLSECPKNKEHVLQDAFGTKLTLTNDVCMSCNSFFSAYDADLVRFVHTLDELRNHEAVGSHDLMFFNGVVSLAFDETSDTWFAYRHSTGEPGTWKREPFPQVLFRPDDSISFLTGGNSSEKWKRDCSCLQSELAQVEKLRITYPDWRTTDHKPPACPLLVRSGKYVYAIVADSPEQRQRVMSQIEQGEVVSLLAKLQAAPSSRALDASEFSFRGRMLDPLVPIAKIGFNFACHVLGNEAMHRLEFDWIRRYARYGEQPDSAFACIFDKDARAAHLKKSIMTRKLCSSPGHKLLIHARPGLPLQVLIVLYEHLFASVDLLRAEQTFWLPEKSWLAIFDYRSKTHEVLSSAENFERLFTLTGARLAYQRRSMQRRRRLKTTD